MKKNWAVHENFQEIINFIKSWETKKSKNI